MSDDYGLKVINKEGEVLAGSDFFIGTITETIQIPPRGRVEVPKILTESKGSKNFFMISLGSYIYVEDLNDRFLVINGEDELVSEILIVRGAD